PVGDRVYASAPIAAGSSVFVGSLDRQLYALDAGSGALRWRFATNGPITSSAVIARGVVPVGSEGGHVYTPDGRAAGQPGLDDAPGVRLWSANAGAPIMASPALGARTVYVATTRTLVAYRLPG